MYCTICTKDYHSFMLNCVVFKFQKRTYNKIEINILLFLLYKAIRIMEKRLNKKIEEYIGVLKNDIKEKATNLELTSNEANQLLTFIYDYNRLVLDKDDFIKRKRVKNVIPFFDRCCAKRASGEQCTRRKKEDCGYCGTHLKGTPHGMVDLQQDINDGAQKIEVWAQDIMGIIYYIDKFGNVYQPEDIVVNKVNPKVIAKYVKTEDNVYSIPEFGI